MKPTIKGLLFDKDGTLFDFAHTWENWAEAFLMRTANGDRAFATQIGQAIGFDLERCKFAPDSVVIAATPSDIVDAMIGFFPDLTPVELLTVLNDEAEKAPQIEAVPLIPLLTYFQVRGLKLGVATNDSIAPAIAHLKSANIVDHFDFIAGFDSGYGGKPAPGQMLAFAQHVGLSPSQIAMVGDSLNDLNAGRAAGMYTIGVLTGLAGREVLTPHAEVVLDDIGMIPAWLDHLGKS